MFVFIIRRAIETIPVLWFVATLTFFMVRLAPGGPFSAERHVSPETLASLNQHYGLDKPLVQQYFTYLGKVVKGDLGPSFAYRNRTVNEIIAAKFPVSLQLGLLAMAFALVAGVTAGTLAATKSNCPRDYVPMSLAMLGICLPSFVLGPCLVWLFALKLGWVNVLGWETLGDMVLPTLTLGALYAANIARLARGGMLEVMSMDFIRVARAKGVPEWKIAVKHALRGGMLPVVSYLGPAVAGVVTGSFVVETIFQIPGLGREFIQAALNRDYTMIMGTVLFYAVLIVVCNTVVDILQVALDPRLSFKDKA